jgi:DNA-binding transcriptional MerR regulator
MQGFELKDVYCYDELLAEEDVADGSNLSKMILEYKQRMDSKIKQMEEKIKENGFYIFN